MSKLQKGIYKHYKGQYYEVVSLAKDSENAEDIVLYRALYGQFGLWVRPLTIFLESVEVAGQKQPRFEFISNTSSIKAHYQFHHIGIPTTQVLADERYSPTFKMYTSGGEAPTRIQYHRFVEGCPLHPLIQSKPHVAFKVDSIEDAIEGKNVILEPYYPFENFRVAMIEENGCPIEFIETSLPEEEIWNDSAHKNSIIYPAQISE